MGDRNTHGSAGTQTSFGRIEEPWALLHASTLQTIWEERARTREGHAPRPTEQLWQTTRLRFARDAQDHIRWVLQQREYLDEEMLHWLEKEEKPLSISHTYKAWQESGVGTLHLHARVPFMLHTAMQDG